MTHIREQQLQTLKHRQFDVAIIGGGASGLGCALDAAQRGLSVALIEAQDFASGTSSKSSKLIHGGVRYLELAVKQRDLNQLQLVRDALRERAILKRIAPHIVHDLRLLTPCQHKLHAAYYWCGLQAYDVLAGHHRLQATHYIGSHQSQHFAQHIQAHYLSAMVAYTDAQFDDAAMAMALLESARNEGASLLNYCSATALDITPGSARIQAHDHILDQDIEISSHVVINCSGMYSDHIRELDNPQARKIIHCSIGAHIVVDRSFWPHQEAVLIPKTADDRVLFILPWHDHILIGTTDETVDVTSAQQCSQAHSEQLMRDANVYLKQQIQSTDIRSAWAGIRPLLMRSGENNSSQLIRDHRVEISDNGLVSLGGGKWTTYRLMAEDCIDQCVQAFQLQAGPCISHKRALAHSKPKTKLEEFCDWSVHNCQAQHIDDILARRSHLAFCNYQAAIDLIPQTAAHMAQHLNWSSAQKQREIDYAEERLSTAFSIDANH